MKNGPNKTVFNARNKVGYSQEHKERVEEAKMNRLKNDPVALVMEKVFSGEISPEEGARQIEEMMNEGN